MLDRWLFRFFILGLLILAFIGGVATSYYKLAPATLVLNGMEAASAWHERFEETGLITDTVRIPADNSLKANVTIDATRAYDGYTLISLRTGSTVYLVDMQGNIVHRWEVPHSRIWPNPPQVSHPVSDGHVHVERAQLFPNGDLLVTYEAMGDTPYGYGMVKVDKDSKVIWTFDKNTHHDFYIEQDSGNIYTLMQQFTENPIPGLEDLEYPALTDYIAKLTPDGKELFRFSVLDAFRGTPFEHLLHYNVSNKPWDHMHTNAIMKIEPSEAASYPMFKAGDILISVRNMHAIAIIDPDTQKVVWAHQDIWRGQHAARLLPSGHMLIFDNVGAHNHASRVLEFNPNNSQITWSFEGNAEHPFFSGIHGSLQRLPNGNTLIAETMNARALEVTPDGTVVWNYDLPKDQNNSGIVDGITTAYRYSKGSLAFLP